MYYPTILSTLISLSTLLISTSQAQPITETKVPANYYLKTQLVPLKGHKDTGTNKSHLWVSSYHTGAGLGDAVLSTDKSGAWPGYLNNTQQLFKAPGAESLGPWPMEIEYGPYQEWNVVQISIAAEYPSDGFFFNSTGLQYNQSTGGWLACDWWHGVPQLFNVNEYDTYKLTSSCSKVNLIPVAV